MSGRTCEAFADLDTASGFCGEPAIGTVLTACEHEHVNERPICAACAAEFRRDDGPYDCSHCDVECRFRIEIRFFGGPALVLQAA